MKIHFLGSGASEGIPNPFCRCDLCRRVRQIKGKDVRTHSSVIIDDVLLIDIAPTFSHQILRDGVDACAITDLLFTHTHPDHFNVAELTNRMEGFGHGQQHPLNIYGNDMAISGCVETFNGYRGSRFQLHCLAPFVTVDCGAFQVTPLLANHAKWELCYVWYIEKGGEALFYGHDSGWYPEQTWRWLENRVIDTAVLECTYGAKEESRSDNHMTFATVLSAMEKLRAQGCLHARSNIILSHISHTSALLHKEMVARWQPHGVTVAWDGLIID